MSTDGFIGRWLTVKEAAAYTRTDEDWILEHIRVGALKFVPTARRKSAGPKGPKRRIIDRLKLDALMERLETSESVALPVEVPVAAPKRSAGASAAKRPGVRERLARGKG